MSERKGYNNSNDAMSYKIGLANKKGEGYKVVEESRHESIFLRIGGLLIIRVLTRILLYVSDMRSPPYVMFDVIRDDGKFQGIVRQENPNNVYCKLKGMMHGINYGTT